MDDSQLLDFLLNDVSAKPKSSSTQSRWLNDDCDEIIDESVSVGTTKRNPRKGKKGQDPELMSDLIEGLDELILTSEDTTTSKPKRNRKEKKRASTKDANKDIASENPYKAVPDNEKQMSRLERLNKQLEAKEKAHRNKTQKEGKIIDVSSNNTLSASSRKKKGAVSETNENLLDGTNSIKSKKKSNSKNKTNSSQDIFDLDSTIEQINKMLAEDEPGKKKRKDKKARSHEHRDKTKIVEEFSGESNAQKTNRTPDTNLAKEDPTETKSSKTSRTKKRSQKKRNQLVIPNPKITTEQTPSSSSNKNEGDGTKRKRKNKHSNKTNNDSKLLSVEF